jgi:hypothetical protein
VVIERGRPKSERARRLAENGSLRGIGDYSLCSSSHSERAGKAAAVLMAIHISKWPAFSKWPGVNEAFIFSFILSSVLALAVIPYSKRRPKGTPVSWGEAMLAAVYVFGVMFLAFGVVPHQWIAHSDANLAWTKSKIIYGPFDILKPKALGGHFPFTASYEAIRDTVVVVLHVWYFGLIIYLWGVWQKRGDAKPSTEVATSTYGRPLVRKG